MNKNLMTVLICLIACAVFVECVKAEEISNITLPEAGQASQVLSEVMTSPKTFAICGTTDVVTTMFIIKGGGV